MEGLRRIQQGSVPDVYASVDIELAADVKDARQIYSLGRFKLALACARPIASVSDLRGAKTALADPNKAPIGYRELAVAYMKASTGVDRGILALMAFTMSRSDSMPMGLSGLEGSTTTTAPTPWLVNASAASSRVAVGGTVTGGFLMRSLTFIPPAAATIPCPRAL